MIYEVRGQRVMLDFDLAEMYGVETRRLNEQVKRNIERFPEDFMFQLTKGELETLRSQIATSNSSDNQKDTNWTSQIATSNFAKMGLRKTPYAFTENGVAMLSSVLRSPLAIQVNIGIMRAFTAFRHLATSLPKSDVTADVAQLRKDFEDLKLDIEDILHDQNDINEETRAQLDAISTALSELQSTPPHSPIVPSWVLASQVIRNNSFTLNKLQCLGTLYIHDAFLRLCDETALISSQILRQKYENNNEPPNKLAK